MIDFNVRFLIPIKPKYPSPTVVLQDSNQIVAKIEFDRFLFWRNDYLKIKNFKNRHLWLNCNSNAFGHVGVFSFENDLDLRDNSYGLTFIIES